MILSATSTRISSKNGALFTEHENDHKLFFYESARTPVTLSQRTNMFALNLPLGFSKKPSRVHMVYIAPLLHRCRRMSTVQLRCPSLPVNETCNVAALQLRKLDASMNFASLMFLCFRFDSKKSQGGTHLFPSLSGVASHVTD